MKRTLRLVLVLSITSTIPATLAAREEPPAPPAASSPVPGLYAFTDPETGKTVEPGEGSLLELPGWSVEQALRTDSADLVVEEDAFGVLTVDLRGRFQSALFVRIAADGTVTVDHDPAILQAPEP